LNRPGRSSRPRKPIFIDKPVAGLAGRRVRIYDLGPAKAARRASQLLAPLQSGDCRDAQAIRASAACSAATPYGSNAPLEPSPSGPVLLWHPRLRVVVCGHGPGCKTVTRVRTPTADLRPAFGRTADWACSADTPRPDGFRGHGLWRPGDRSGRQFEGYGPLLVEIAKFFRTGKPTGHCQRDPGDLCFMEAAMRANVRAACRFRWKASCTRRVQPRRADGRHIRQS